MTLLVTFGAVYAAWDDVVSSGDPVRSSSWNALVSQIKSQEIPTGFVGSFNLSSCPTGWSPADGTNGTPDLRGEFIRGLDNGRGVDAGRNLASAQDDTFQGHQHNQYSANMTATIGGFISGSTWYVGYQNGGDYQEDTINGYGVPRVGSETRPRNIALLYCVKD